MRKYIVLFALLLSAIIFGIYFGQAQLFPVSDFTRSILWDFRIPRVLFAGLNGAMLSVAGVMYQISLRNPMADGFTTGAASSAAFGGCLALVLVGNPWLVVVCAFAFAMAGVALVRYVADKATGMVAGSGGNNAVTVILAGMTLSVIASSGISFLKYFYEQAVNTLVFWLMGSVARGGWMQVGIVAVVFMGVMCWIVVNRAKIGMLFLDDQSVATSGIDVVRLRRMLFAITTLLVAVSVSFCGIIGFVGLIVPHAVRMIFGHNATVQILCSALLGGIALIAFDMIARTALNGGAELPIGVITSLCGGMFFGALLLKRGTSVWN